MLCYRFQLESCSNRQVIDSVVKICCSLLEAFQVRSFLCSKLSVNNADTCHSHEAISNLKFANTFYFTICGLDTNGKHHVKRDKSKHFHKLMCLIERTDFAIRVVSRFNT